MLQTARGVRTVSLDPDTVSALREHRRRQVAERLAWGEAWTDTGLVFGREDGKPLDPTYVTRRFGPTDGLRRPAADPASERLGHSSITRTMNTYTHIAPALAVESAKRRAALIRRVTVLPGGHAVPTACPQGAGEAATGSP